MSIARTIITAFRKIQFTIYKRNYWGSMPKGVNCTHDPFEEEINHGDVVHPCVRYIEDGYEGHHWWMVYTPYYTSNYKTENPILCYGANDDAEPPTHWHIYCQVQAQPSKGYNSDPNLLYADGKLYVFWRESETQRCEDTGYVRATFGGIVKDGGIHDIFGPVVGAVDTENDPETSPTFLQESDGSFRCLAMNLTFHSKFTQSLPPVIKKFISPILSIVDILGIWSQQKHHGIAQWSCKTVDGEYHLDRTVRFSNQNKLYRPWHMDFFEHEERLYAIVQTNQCNADICLAVSEDYINFRFFDKPLMTNATCKKLGIYKPTGGVAGGRFYLYYTAQNPENRALNKLYLSTIDFPCLLS